MAQNYRNTGALLPPDKLEQQDLRGLEESTRMTPKQSSNNSNLLADKDMTQSKKKAPGTGQEEQQASSVAQNMQEAREAQVAQDMRGTTGAGEARDGIAPNLTGALPGVSSVNPNASNSATLSKKANENANNKNLGIGTALQDQSTSVAPKAFGAPPQNADWPQVASTTTNYDRTAADILLNKIFTDTKGLYTVGSAVQIKDWAIDSMVGQIDAKGGNGESMRKPLNALLDETKRDALPVYMEKAKFKGADCWLIVIRWGFGDDRSELSKASLYVTDSTGWKTLYYQSK
jgi:hypothetical protein